MIVRLLSTTSVAAGLWAPASVLRKSRRVFLSSGSFSGERALLTETPFDPAGASLDKFVREERWLIDRTEYLPLLAKWPQAKQFVRPQRFGKSLLLRTLAEYLDVRNAGPALGPDGKPRAVEEASGERVQRTRFDQLFGRFAVGRMSPEERFGASEYFVLRLDFAGFPDWRNVVREAGLDFARKYPELKLQRPGPADKPGRVIRSIVKAVRDFQQRRGLERESGKLAVLIDEYDAPFNRLLNPRDDDSSARTGGALYKSLEDLNTQVYARLKSVLGKNPNFLVYITGVLSLSLDGLTSGFNIQDDISMDPLYSSLLGLTENEVREGVRLALLTRKFGDGGVAHRAALRRRALDDACERDGDAVDGGVLDGDVIAELTVAKAAVDEHMEKMRFHYNGFCFVPDSPTQLVFNPVMVASYLEVLTNTGLVREYQCYKEQIELPVQSQQLLIKRPGVKDLLVKLAADVTEDLPKARIRRLVSPARLKDSSGDGVTHMLLLQFAAATFLRRDDGVLVLRRPNTNVQSAILDLLFQQATEDQQARLRRIVLELTLDGRQPAAVLVSIREFLSAALDFPAVGTPISKDSWQWVGGLEADLLSRLVAMIRMVTEPDDVFYFGIEAPATKKTTGNTGNIGVIVGEIRIHLKVVDFECRKTFDEANICSQLGIQAGELQAISDEDLASASAHYQTKLEEATADANNYVDDPARRVVHKFAVVQILPNRVLVRRVQDQEQEQEHYQEPEQVND